MSSLSVVIGWKGDSRALVKANLEKLSPRRPGERTLIKTPSLFLECLFLKAALKAEKDKPGIASEQKELCIKQINAVHAIYELERFRIKCHEDVGFCPNIQHVRSDGSLVREPISRSW